MKIKCSFPVLLFNRSVVQTMVDNGNYVADGVVYTVPRRWLYDFPYHKFLPYKLGLYRSATHPAGYYCADDVDERFYTFSPATGEVTPLFMLAHCGHCDMCNARRIKEYSYRVVCEASCYDVPPIFITLTYSPEYLPADGVQVRDVQLFFKSLRHLVSDKFRYCLVSEYGHDDVYRDYRGRLRQGTSRPHYHAVLFGVRVDKSEVDAFVDKIQRAWSVDLRKDSSKGRIVRTHKDVTQHLYKQQRGAVDVEFIKFSKACGLYVSKYLMKPKNVPVGMNKNFVCTSRRDGGIGAPFLTKHDVINYLRKYPRCRQFKYKNYDGEVCELRMCSYYFQKIFPSRSRMIPVEYRKAVNGVQCLCNELMKVYPELRDPLCAVGIEDFGVVGLDYRHARIAHEQSEYIKDSIYELCDVIDKYPPPDEELIATIQRAKDEYLAVPRLDFDMRYEQLKAVKLLNEAYELDTY